MHCNRNSAKSETGDPSVTQGGVSGSLHAGDEPEGCGEVTSQ
jgi:hypothetical protein